MADLSPENPVIKYAFYEGCENYDAIFYPGQET